MPQIKEKSPPPYHAAKKANASRHTRTNVVLDRALVEKAKAKFGVRTAREAIHASMEAATRTYDYTDLLAAYGSGGIADDYDPKATSSPKYLGWQRVHEEDLTPVQAKTMRRRLAAQFAGNKGK